MMLEHVPFARWLTEHWMRAGIVMATLLLAITPVLMLEMRWMTVLVYLQLPVYMIHQYEEHANAAFQRWTTNHMGNGIQVLSDRDILWINIGLVWALDVVWLLLSVLVNPAWGLVAAAMPVVNGLGHIVFAIKDRAYNPGLWTSLFLFMPFGLYALLTIGNTIKADTSIYALSIFGAVLTHLPIVLFVQAQLRNKTANQALKK